MKLEISEYLKELMSGDRLPRDEEEEVFIYAYTAGMTGSNLYETFTTIYKDIDNTNAELISSLCIGYAMAEIQLLNTGGINLTKGDLN